MTQHRARPTTDPRRRAPRRGRDSVVVAALGMLALTGCGPGRPLSVGVKSIYSNVILGNQSQPPIPPTPPAANLTPAFPLAIQPPLPSTPVPVSTRPVASPGPPTSFGKIPPSTSTPSVTIPPAEVCPPTDPNLPVSDPATLVVEKPPVNGTYPFRDIGTYTLTGAKSQTTTYPPFTTRIVTRMPDDPSGNYWNYSETDQDPSSDSAVTTYFSIEHTQTFVYPVSGVGPVPSNQDISGIYLTGIDLKRADGSIDSFRPEPALELMETPAVAGESGSSAGSDPLSQTTMSFDWLNDGLHPVEACGKVVGAWEVSVTNGQVVGNSSQPGANPKNLTFSGTYYFATEDGGIDVGDSLVAQGTDGSVGVKVKMQSYIDVIPNKPS